MTDIQRWGHDPIIIERGYDADLVQRPDGEYVLHADHVAALLTQDRQHMEQQDAAVAEADRRSYDLGRDDGIVLGQEQAHRDLVIIHEGAAKNRGFREGYEQGQRDALAKVKQIADDVIATDDGTSTASHAMRYLLTMLGGDK